ncbi:PDR/VanB family oxidoreductase [Notoacmeibacter marinus]|uniref:PDR/VanB family oxidoreductase n=1 Tax=Notoacmeibacter marinus TaxID=1876515 RepID=UPI000DF3294A|nr:PDR/VanB family oxidoreductase [Notoacmeibacter marinus]
MAMKLLQKTVVEAVSRETDRVRAVTLRHAYRPQLQSFEAGAHVTVQLPNGIRRPYSLCSDPADSVTYRIGVLLEAGSRGGGIGVHALRPGDELFVTYPANQFQLTAEPGHSVLIAGGIGITPILAMIYECVRNERSFELHYCGRTLQDMAFLEEIRTLCPADRLFLYADEDPTAPRRLDFEELLTGMSETTHAYCCGPAGMLEAYQRTAVSLAISAERIHFEQFSALAASDNRFGPAFQIEISKTGETFEVSEQQTALEALHEHGIDVPFSCEGGICGECRTELLSGDVDHRDKVLGEDERQRAFMPCVSRGRGRIVIDP